MRKNYYIGIGAVTVLIIVGSYWYFTVDNSVVIEIETETEKTNTTISSEGSRTVPVGWKEYRSDTYSFSLFYPQGFSVEEYSEGGGASTIVFENIDEVKGFQIFILPYNEEQVSEKRFREDVPSGVRKDLTDINIDGATAAAFYSKNVLLGETREIWIVQNDYLYEVTTLKLLDKWLEEIMKTWKFL